MGARLNEVEYIHGGNEPSAGLVYCLASYSRFAEPLATKLVGLATPRPMGLIVHFLAMSMPDPLVSPTGLALLDPVRGPEDSKDSRYRVILLSRSEGTRICTFGEVVNEISVSPSTCLGDNAAL